ncbi:MAG: CotH kinase family protein [Micrococcales bacterium]
MQTTWSKTTRMLITALLALAMSFGSTLVGATSAQAADAPSGASYIEGNDPAATIFDPLVVNRADITLPTQSYNNLQANGKGDYQPGTFVFTTKNGASQSYDVGVRLKGGWGSLRNLDGKAGFKVKMNFSVKGQKLFGIKKFTFNNMVQDPSMLHEAVVYRLFRAMGVPAPRIGYVRVYVNGVDYGLHLNVETYDDVMLQRWFASTQHLYEGAYWQDIVDGQYQAMQIDEGDLNKRDDLAALALVNNTKDGKEWFDAVQKYLDLDEFVKEIAVERYIGHWDGYAWTIKNNYYAHSTAEGIFTILPWGTDQTLNGWVDMYSAGDVGIMAVKCINYSPCQQLYKGAMLKVNATAQALQLAKMIDEVWNSINADIQSDPRKESGFDWATQVKDGAKNHVNWISGYITDVVNSNNQIGSPRLERSSNVSVKYSIPQDLAPGDSLSPIVSKDGGAGDISYLVTNGAENCSVGFTTGIIKITQIGYCRISVKASASASWAASINYFEILNSGVVGHVTIDPFGTLKLGQSKEITFTSSSKAAPELTVIGDCTNPSGMLVTATIANGECTVTIDVPGDGTWDAASDTLTFTTIRGDAIKPLTRNLDYKGSLPNGGSVEMTQIPTKIVGNCKRVGRILYAKAAVGLCLVYFSATQDSNWNYAATTHTVQLQSGVQTIVGDLTAPGTYVAGSSKWLIAKQAEIKTNFGAATTWTTAGKCSVSVISGKTFVTVRARPSCTVTLRSKPYLGLPVITKTWVLKY